MTANKFKNDRDQYLYFDGAPYPATGLRRYLLSPVTITAGITAAFALAAQTMLMRSGNGQAVDFICHLVADAAAASTYLKIAFLGSSDIDTVIKKSRYTARNLKLTEDAKEFYKITCIGGLILGAGFAVLSALTRFRSDLIPGIDFVTQTFDENQQNNLAGLFKLINLGTTDYFASTALHLFSMSALTGYATYKFHRRQWSAAPLPKTPVAKSLIAPRQ